MVCGQLMARPRSSGIGLADFTLDVYSANKLRKMGSEFDSLHRNQDLMLSAIGNLAELQVATMHGIMELGSQLQELSEISWSIANYFEKKEAREDFLGDLKLVLIKLNQELDSIDQISENYPEYATLQLENIQSILEENDVRIEHFKTLPPENILWAKEILDKVENTYSHLIHKLSNEGK